MDNRIFTSHTETRILSKILILCKLKIMASWGYFITPNHWCCSCSFSGSSFIPSVWKILLLKELKINWRLKAAEDLKNSNKSNFGWMKKEWIKILRKTWGKIFGVDNIALSGSIFFGVKKIVNGIDWMDGFGPIEDCGRDLNHKTQISFTVNRFCGFLWFSNNMK